MWTTLAGVIVGAIVAGISNFLLQRTADNRRWARDDTVMRKQWQRQERMQKEQWRREDQVRYQLERVRLYSEFRKVSLTLVAYAGDKAAKHDHYSPIQELPVFSEEKESELNNRIVSELYPQISLMASENVKKAAESFVNVIQRTSYEALAGDEIDWEDYDRLLSKYSQQFLEAATEELDVPIDMR